MNLIQDLKNVAVQHKNAPHAVLISELHKEVVRFNKTNSTKFNIYNEVDNFIRWNALFGGAK